MFFFTAADVIIFLLQFGKSLNEITQIGILSRYCGELSLVVFIPKYRKKVLYGKVREDVREILNTLCKYKNVEIIAGAVCVDHVHLSVAIPPKLSVSDFMGYLKGKSTLMLYDRHPEMQSKWDKAFWARGYYVETIGNITDEAVQKYIKEQAEESRKEDSRSTAL